MNRIVVRLVAGSMLPPELLGDIDPNHVVEVTVRDLEQQSAGANGTSLAALTGLGRGVYGTADEILLHVDELRQDRDA
jgi:hypothetical protein